MQAQLPDGLQAEHALEGIGLRTYATPVSALVLGGVLLAAMCGVLGGYQADRLSSENANVRLEVEMPAIVRNGEFLETRISILPRREIRQLVLAISAELWTNVTINTMFPQASEETYASGFYRFAYGAAKPDSVLVVKIDGQINPQLFGNNHGEIAVFDGDDRLLNLPLTLAVRP